MTAQDKKLTPEEQEFIEKLYSKYFNQVYIYVNARLKDDDKAQDIVQDVFHEAIEHIDKLMTHEKPIAWLKKAAWYKLSVNKRSTQRMIQRLISLDAVAIDEAAAKDDSEFQRVEEGSENPLKRVQDALTDDEFRLLRRLTFDKESHLVVARDFGITVWSSQKRLERIREKLRSVFPGYRKKKK